MWSRTKKNHTLCHYGSQDMGKSHAIITVMEWYPTLRSNIIMS